MLGMVNIQHGKRTEVCPAEEWDILSAVVQEAMRREGNAEPLLRDLYEFRLLIEPEAAGWMAEHGKAAQLEELAELAAEMERLAEMGVAVAEVLRADRSFHDLVARASDNRVLAAVSRDIREVIGTLWGFTSLDAPAAKQVAEQHRQIADAVQRRDPRAAAAAMREHLTWAAQADLHGLGDAARALRLASTSAAE
jgi:DNA-binding FadR family transcriptional regulator